jgi:integrase
LPAAGDDDGALDGGALLAVDAKQKLPPLPDRLTPHSLRRTLASVLYAIGEDPGVVMDEMGHTDPGLALRVYRQAMRRGRWRRRSFGR